jgi:uncharacterized protein (TIGR03083 family)
VVTDLDVAAQVADARQAYLQALLDVQALAHQLTPDSLDLPTDCPGWSVRDHVAHVAGLESILLGRTRSDHEPDWDAMPYIRNNPGRYMEVDVDLRRPWPWAQVLGELDEVLGQRVAEIASLPDDPDHPVLGPLGAPRPLLPTVEVRAFDVWQHDQDIRHATGRPATMRAPAAAYGVTRIRGALPSILAEDAAAPAGTTLRWTITDDRAQDVVVAVADDGTAAEVEADALVGPPTVSITTDAETFTLLGTGRRAASELVITVEGDAELAARLLAEMAVTP